MRSVWKWLKSSRNVKNSRGSAFFVWRDVHHLEEELERVEEELAYRLEKEEEKKKERQRGKKNMEKVSWMRFVRKNGGFIQWSFWCLHWLL